MRSSSSCSAFLLFIALLDAGCGQADPGPGPDGGPGPTGVTARSHEEICADATAAPTTLAAADSVASVAALGTTVFFTALGADASPAVLRVPRDGGTAEVLVEPGGVAPSQVTRSIVSDGTDVYYPFGPLRIMHVTEHGQPDYRWTLPETPSSARIVVDSSTLFVSTYNLGGTLNGAFTGPKSGGTLTNSVVLDTPFFPQRLGADGEHLYLQVGDATSPGAPSSLQRYPRAGGAATVLGSRIGEGVVADAKGVYFTQYDATTEHEALVHIAPGSETPESLWTFDRVADIVRGLALANDAIYVLQSSVTDKTVKVTRVPRDGGCAGQIAKGGTVDTNVVNDEQPIAVDDTFVYWVADSGIMKAAR